MTQRMILTRGIPASGKTTFAKTWVLAGENRVRINRDDIRMNVFGVEYGCDENVVTKIQHAMLREALKAGQSVIVDDTNLNSKFMHKLMDIANDEGVEVFVKTFPIELSEAMRRNKLRDRQVPDDVMREMHRRYVDMGPMDFYQYPEKIEPYVPIEGSPKAIMVDIDGTLAKMVNRSPFDWQKVYADEVVHHVAEVVRMTQAWGWDTIVMSGRDSSCRDLTKGWLYDKADIHFDALYMRAENDNRKDSIVKKELFDKYVRPYWNIQFVLDDRDQVVKMWRKLGLACFQVAEGDF